MAHSSPAGPPEELRAQLVPEFVVRSLDASLKFYTALGFTVSRGSEQFAVLRWQNAAYLFLAEGPGRLPHTGSAVTNVRVIVPNVDEIWQLVRSRGLTIESPIADQRYGLRDFSVRDPDGFALRFAAILTPKRMA